MTDLLTDLNHALTGNARFIEAGSILRSEVIRSALADDPTLFALLLSSPRLRRHFFTEVGEALVFRTEAFVRFVSSRALLDDSYTAFRNQVGLATGGTPLRDLDPVVLEWPFKDCVLEGGMSKEDAGRDEVFWNRSLAPDQITRLFEPKAFCRFEAWDAPAAQAEQPGPVSSVDGSENLLIQGNNLIALHSLKARFAGQVQTIYIDPPYNTGNDSFRYNDRFSHAAWLTFMRNRLEVARELLREDGAIFVQIGDQQAAYLKVLMDEVFPGQFINQITVRTRSPSGFATVNQGVFETAEYIYIYGKDKSRWRYRRQYAAVPYDTNYRRYIPNPTDPPEAWQVQDLRDVVARTLGFEDAKKATRKLGKVAFQASVADFALAHAAQVFRLTTINRDAHTNTLATKAASKGLGRVLVDQRPGQPDRYVYEGEQLAFYAAKIREVNGQTVPTTHLTNIWTDIAWEGIASEGGVRLKRGKKPERLLRRILAMSTEPGDLVLDFHAGSGTTAAVAHKMGRRWIAIEQLDYIRELTLTRMNNVVRGDPTGISKLVGWTGGGSFVYLELARWNAALAATIQTCPESELSALRHDVLARGHLRHDIQQAALAGEGFDPLTPAQQRAVLLEALDANHLYVSRFDQADETYGLTIEEQCLTDAFYGSDDP